MAYDIKQIALYTMWSKAVRIQEDDYGDGVVVQTHLGGWACSGSCPSLQITLRRAQHERERELNASRQW